MPNLNPLGILLAIVIVIGAIIALLLPLKLKQKKDTNILTHKELQRCREESILNQAFNSTIFKNKNVHQVVLEGGKMVSNDGYKLLQGVKIIDV